MILSMCLGSEDLIVIFCCDSMLNNEFSMNKFIICYFMFSFVNTLWSFSPSLGAHKKISRGKLILQMHCDLLFLYQAEIPPHPRLSCPR